jgi:plasmid stabilization system protein ParE
VTDLARLLGEHPRIGMSRLEIADEPLRFAVVSGFPYVVLYDPTPDPPLILRVLHGGGTCRRCCKNSARDPSDKATAILHCGE